MYKLDDVSILGKRGILVQLKEFEAERVSEHGIIIQAHKNGLTDGGRVTTERSDEIYSTEGTIVKISPQAASHCEEEDYPLRVGDTVYVSKHAKKNHNNWFYINRNTEARDHTGLVRVVAEEIECKIKSDGDK